MRDYKAPVSPTELDQTGTSLTVEFSTWSNLLQTKNQ